MKAIKKLNDPVSVTTPLPSPSNAAICCPGCQESRNMFNTGGSPLNEISNRMLKENFDFYLLFIFRLFLKKECSTILRPAGLVAKAEEVVPINII